MKRFALPAYAAAFSLALFAASCMSDSGGDDPPNPPPPPADSASSAQGTFRISMSGPNLFSSTGSTSLSGTIYDTTQPVSLGYKDGPTSGACKLLIAEAPSCSPACTDGDICERTAGGGARCQPQADPVSVGRITVTGLKDRNGGTSFQSSPISPTLLNYQVPSGTILQYPPCAEGAAVSLAAEGSSDVAAFSLETKCIAPLKVKEGEVRLEDAQPLVVEWTPPVQPGSKVQVDVNIDNHGGNRGKVTCEAADNGRLEIAIPLLDSLKALGITGFPTVEVTRYVKGTTDKSKVELVLEEKVTKELTIPGIISCTRTDPTECPDGKVCTEAYICE